MSSSNSTGLSASATNRLRKNLTALAEDRVFPVVLETALFAVFTVFILFSTWVLSKRGVRSSWSNQLMFGATLAMYALSTLDWAIDVRLLYNDLRALRLVGLPDAPRAPFGLSSPLLLTVQGITSVVCIILGDAVVCWRVCVVWANHRRVAALALFWTIGSIGVFTAWSVMFVGFYYDVPPAVLTLVEHNVIMNAFAFSWSAATNVWATAMVAFKAWQQRREFRRHLRSSGMAVHNILTLIVDFGVIYTAFMLLNVIVLAPSLNGGTFFSYVTLMMQQITGMYPTAVIALVALRRSALEHHFTFASSSATSLRSPGGLSPGGAGAGMHMHGEDSLLPFHAHPARVRYRTGEETDVSSQTASAFAFEKKDADADMEPDGVGRRRGARRVVTLRAPVRSTSTGVTSVGSGTEVEAGRSYVDVDGDGEEMKEELDWPLEKDVVSPGHGEAR